LRALAGQSESPGTTDRQALFAVCRPYTDALQITAGHNHSYVDFKASQRPDLTLMSANHRCLGYWGLSTHEGHAAAP